MSDQQQEDTEPSIADDDSELEPADSRIAIIGGGPLGIETLLYARYLGYDAGIYEQHAPAHTVNRVGELLDHPTSQLATSLGRAALYAQDEAFSFPNDESRVTGQQFAERYLLPLCRSDLLKGRILGSTVVVSVTASEGSSEYQLRRRIRDPMPESEAVNEARIVIDVSGAAIDGIVSDRRNPGNSFLQVSPGLYRIDADTPVAGHAQIRDLFAVIAQRADLDLYESVKNLLP